MKAIIIDDEESVRSGLEQLCTLFIADLEISGSASSLKEAIELIREKSPDLIFLDIQLGNENGFDILTAFPQAQFQTIFVTAHDEYALKALKKQAVDYLLKPVDPEDLIEAVEKVKQKKRLNPSKLEKLIIKESETIQAIDISEILYLAANGSYTTIQTRDRQFVSSKNIKHYEGLLESMSFLRVHKSYLVNMRHFEKFDKIMNQIILDNGFAVQVSARKRDQLYAFIKKEAF